jgi:hypothetical protein
VARRAGDSVDTSVTTMPTTIDTTMVRVAMTLSPDGSSKPTALNSSRRPVATRMPSASPAMLPRIPSTSPSLRTERRTWPREAPRVRSRANSRARWATVIEKVLKMMNAPTNREIPAKASRAVFRKPRSSRIPSDWLDASWLPVLTSSVRSGARRDRPGDRLGVAPAATAALISS